MKKKNSRQQFTQKHTKNLRAELLALLDRSNMYLQPERRVPFATAVEVANRDLRKTRNSDPEARVFSALRAVSSFVSLSAKNKVTTSALSNADLLPVGHPMSRKRHAMTASALRHARAKWIAADELVDDSARELVIIAHAADPGSIERIHAFARLMALGPKFVPITAAIDVEPLNPITAAFGFGLGGNSKAARSARAKMQRRDKYGRFAEQGGGFMFNLRMPDGLFSSLSGRVVGASGDEDIEIEVKDHATVPDGIYAIPSSKGTVVKGILSKEALEDANLPEGKEKLDIVGNDDAIDFNDLVRQDAPTGWTRQAPEAEEVPKAGPIQVLRDAAGKKLVRLSNFQKSVFGPRKPGGKYRSGYSGEIYEVLEVRLDENGFPVIRVRGEDGFEREHSTAWDPKRDKIISEPEAKASSSSAQEVFTSEDGYFVKKDGDTLSLHRADLTDNSIGDEVTRGDSWADVVKGAKADQDDYEKVLEAADAADKAGAPVPEAAPVAGPAKRTKQRLESARKGGVDYGSMTDAEIAEMAKAESDEYYKAGVWRVVQPKIPKGGYKTSKGNWKEYDEPVGKPTEEMVVGPEADAIREQFTKERTETLSQLRDAVNSGEIENLPAVRDLTDGNAVQQAIAAKKAKQKFRFNYNGKDREITPSEAYNNPKTGKDNIVGLDENEQIRTFTSDKMSPPNKKSEQPVKKATLEEVAPEAPELSDVKDFTKGAGDPRPEKERNEIEAAINAGQKLRVNYGGKDRVIEPLRIWKNPKTEQENVTAIDHSDGGKEKNFGLLKIEKPSASRDQAIEDAIGRIKDIADRSAKPSGKPIEELDGTPLRMGGPVDVNPNDPTISLQEQMQNAIDNGETVRFDYSGKERVFTPENIYKNPKNGNVNVRGTDDSGESKTFTLDKIEQAEAKPAEPFKRLSALDKVRKAFDKLFSEPNDGEKRRKAIIELKNALDNAVAEGRLSESARFRILEQLDKPTDTGTDYDAAAWSEFLDATKKKPKKREEKGGYISLVRYPGGRPELPEYDLTPYEDESKYYDDEGNLNDLGRKENERREARAERIEKAAKNPKNWKRKGIGFPPTSWIDVWVGPNFGDETPVVPYSSEAYDRAVKDQEWLEKARQESSDKASDIVEMTNGKETIYVSRMGTVSAEEKGFRVVEIINPKEERAKLDEPVERPSSLEKVKQAFQDIFKTKHDVPLDGDLRRKNKIKLIDAINSAHAEGFISDKDRDEMLSYLNDPTDNKFRDNDALASRVFRKIGVEAKEGSPSEPSRDSKIDELWEEFLENDDISELESFLDSAGADATEQNFNEYLEDNGIDGDVNNEDDEDRVRAARRNFFGELYSQDSDNLREKFAEYIKNRDQELYDERVGEPPTGGPGEPPTGGPSAPTGGPGRSPSLNWDGQVESDGDGRKYFDNTAESGDMSYSVREGSLTVVEGDEMKLDGFKGGNDEELIVFAEDIDYYSKSWPRRPETAFFNYLSDYDEKAFEEKIDDLESSGEISPDQASRIKEVADRSNNVAQSERDKTDLDSFYEIREIANESSTGDAGDEDRSWGDLATEAADGNPGKLADFLVERMGFEEDHPRVKDLRKENEGSDNGAYEDTMEYIAEVDAEEEGGPGEPPTGGPGEPPTGGPSAPRNKLQEVYNLVEQAQTIANGMVDSGDFDAANAAEVDGLLSRADDLYSEFVNEVDGYSGYGTETFESLRDSFADAAGAESVNDIPDFDDALSDITRDLTSFDEGDFGPGEPPTGGPSAPTGGPSAPGGVADSDENLGKDDIEILFDYLSNWDIVDKKILNAINTDLMDIAEERQVSIDDIREAMRPLYDSGTFKPENLDKAFNEIAKEIRSRYDLSEPEIMEGTFEVRGEPFGDEPATVKVTKNYDEPGDINIELFTIDGEPFDDIYYESGYSARDVANNVKDSFGPDIESLIVDEKPEESKKWIADQTDKYVKNLAKQLLKDADGYPDEARNDVLEDLITVAADQNDLTPDELDKLRELIAEGQSAPTGGPEGLTDDEKKKILDSFLPKGPKTLEELERGPLRTGGPSDVVPDSVEDLVGDTPDEDAGLEDTAPDLLARRRGKNMTALPDKMPEDADKRTKKFYNPDGSLNESGIKENEKRAKKRAKYLKEVNDPQNWSLKSTKDSPEVKWRWVGGDRGVNGGIDDFTYPPNTAPDSVVEWYQERDRRLAEERKAKQEELEKNPPAPLMTGTDEPQGEDDFDSFVSQEFDSTYDVPDGAYKPNIFSYYEPKGRQEGNSARYTDDPTSLATELDQDELVVALAQAVLPMGNNEASGFGPVNFGDGDEQVPAEALYEALDAQGADAALILAKIYDSAMDPNRGETNVDRHRQRNDDEKKLDAIKAPEQPQLEKKLSPDEEARQRNKQASTPSNAQILLDEMADYEETNQGIIDIADELRKIQEIAETEEESLKRELNRQIFNFESIEGFVQKYIDLALSNDPEDQAAFAGLWGMLMSIDGGSSSPEEITGSSIRKAVYNAIEEKFGAGSRTNEVYDEFNAKYGGFIEFVNGKMDIINGDADLDSGSSAAGFLRLMKAASAPNEEELQRSFGVSHMNPELLEQYTTVGNIISIDPRPFSTWGYSKSLTTGYGSQWAPKSAKDNQVVLVAAPGELDSISAVGVSWFDMELEHLAHGQFEVVSVERIPQSMGRADAFVVQIKRADTSVEEMAAERAIAEAQAFEAPAPQPSSPPPTRKIYDVSGWTRVAEKETGSNEGAFYEDENGQGYYVKVPQSQSHAENEVLASAFYEAFGAPAAEVNIGDKDGFTRIVSKLIPNAKQDLRRRVLDGDEEFLDGLREHFVVDAWLSNWDVTGTNFENVMSDENGRPVRIDPGGSLKWRAQGQPKGGAFGSEVGELDTLRDPDRNSFAGAVFGGMTDEDLLPGAKMVRDMSPSKIDQIVDSVVTDPEEAEFLKERLKARRQNLMERFGLDEIDETPVFTEPVPLTESMGTPAQDLQPGDVTANDSFTIERVFTDESTPKGKVSVEGYYPGHETQRKEWNQETIIDSVRGGETPPKGDKPALHRPKKPYAPTAPAISGALAQELQDAQSWAEIRDIIGDREIIFFDYETTGIGNGSNNVPVQLGAVKVRNGEVVDRFNLFMDPREPLSEWSKINLLDADGNPLTDEHLAQQMGLEEAHAQFADWMGESPILAAHNLPFDREILERINAQGSIDVSPAGYIDTLRMGRDLVKKKTKKNPEGTEGHKLGQLLDHYGIEIQNWHSADADAQSAGDLFNSMLNDAADRPDVDPASLDFASQDRNYSDAKSAHDEAVKKYEEELAQYNMDKAVAAAWNCGGGGGGGIIAAAEENGNSSCNVPPLDEIIENSKVKPGELSDPESITSGNPKSDENPYDSGTGDDSADEVADKYPVDGESYPPTPQQQAVINTFLDNEGEDIVVRAAAGAGKTSTLLALAKRIQKYAPKKRIIYIAFNRSVADEAKGKMPANVEVRTADSISYNWTKQNFPDLMKKQGSKTALVYPKDVVAHLGIPEITTTNDDGKEVAMSPKARAAVVRKAIYNFTISDDVEIGAQHFENPDEVTPELLASAQRWWEDVTSANGKMPFNFNHMKKMWSLSSPDLNSTSSGLKEGADIIFVDEFQDTNDVLGSVVASQANTQNVYVGDQNQAIYQFMGANDWLDKVDTEHDLPLTQSFRFGSNIANVANKFLRFKEQYLGGKKTFRVEGAGKDAGTIVPRGSMEDADAVLVRSNAGAFKAVREELDRGRTVGVTKGFKKDLDDFIVGVEWLQGDPSSRGDRPARMPEELQQFANWQEVLNEAADPNSDLGRKAQILIKDVEDIGVSGLKDLSKRVKVINGAGDKKDFGGSPDLPDNLSTGTSGDLGREVTFEVRDDMIILDGNTFPVKDSIKGSKIAKWNGDLKKWVVPAKTDAERQSALKKIQSAINGETETGNVDVVVTTVHQAKGLEWPKVRIGDDFWGPREDKNNPGEYIYPSEAELNLAYVAVTRAEKELDQGALSWIDDFITGDEAPEVSEEVALAESIDVPEVDRSGEEPNIPEAPVEIVEDSAEPAAPDTGIMYSNKGEAPTEAAKADDLSTVLSEVDAAAADILDEDSLVVKKPSKKKAVQEAYNEFKKLMSELKNGDITEAEAIERLNEIIDSVPEGAGEEGDYLGAFADFMIDVRSILDGTYYQRPSGPNLPPLGSPRGYSKNGKFLTIGKVVRDKWGYKGIVDRYNKSEWINVYIKHTGSGKIYSKNTQLLTTIEEGDDDRDWAYVPGMNLGKLPENWREIATPGEIAQIEEAFATGNKVKAAETKAAKKEGVKLPTTPEAPQTAPETPQTAETSAPKTVNDIVSEINDASGGDKQVAADLLNQYAQSMGLTPEIVDLLKDFLGIKDDGPDGGGGSGGVTPSAPKPSGNGGGGVATKYTEADAAQAANRVNENIRDSGNEDFADATSQSFLKKLSAEVKNAEPNDKTVTVKLDYEVDIDIEDAKALLSYYAGEPYSPKAKAPEGAPKAPDLDPEFAKVLNELDAAPEVTPVFSTEESDIKADDVKPEWQTMSAPRDPVQVADDFYNSYRDEEFGIDLDSTTDEDVRAAKGLLVYQNEMYSLINDRLRSGNAGDEVLDDENGSTYAKDFRKEIIKVTESMDELFDAAPTLTEDTMLYRGIHSEYSDELMRSYEVGDMFTDLGFSSTTISRGQAEDFTDYGEDSYDEDTEKPRLLLEIIAPADTRAIYLPAYLGSSVSHPDEDEVLLDRGTTFRVISKTESADGTTKVMRVAVVNQDRKIKPPEPVEEPKAEEPKKTKEVNPLTTDVKTLGKNPIIAWDEPNDDNSSPVFYDSPEAVFQLKEAVKRGHGFVAIHDGWQTEMKISAIFWDEDKQEYMLTTDISSEQIPLSELEMIVTPDIGAANELLNQPYTDADDHEDDVRNISKIIDQLLSDGEFEKAGDLAGRLSAVTKDRRAESEKKSKAHNRDGDYGIGAVEQAQAKQMLSMISRMTRLYGHSSGTRLDGYFSRQADPEAAREAYKKGMFAGDPELDVTPTGAKKVEIADPRSYEESAFPGVQSLRGALSKLLNRSNSLPIGKQKKKKGTQKAKVKMFETTAVDSGDIEDLQVRANVVRDGVTGEKKIRLQFKLTAWAASDQVKKIRSGEEVWDISKNVDVVSPDVDDNGDLVYGDKYVLQYESPSGDWDQARTFSKTLGDGQRKTKISFIRGYDTDAVDELDASGKAPVMTFHNSVEIFLPLDATDEEIADAFRAAGVSDPRPAEPEDVKVLAENRLLSVFASATNASVNETDPRIRKAQLKRIEEDWDLTPYDVELTTDSAGFLTYKIPEHVAEKIVEATSVKVLDHAYSHMMIEHHLRSAGIDYDNLPEDEQKRAVAEYLVTTITGDEAGLKASMYRFTEGADVQGQSSMSDLRSGSGMYVYTSPRGAGTKEKSWGYTDIHLYFDPRKAYRRVDFYANHNDEWGKRYPSRDVIDAAKAGNYEVMFKHGLSVDDAAYFLVDPEIRKYMLEALDRQGVTEIAGKPVEDFVVDYADIDGMTGGKKEYNRLTSTMLENSDYDTDPGYNSVAAALNDLVGSDALVEVPDTMQVVGITGSGNLIFKDKKSDNYYIIDVRKYDAFGGLDLQNSNLLGESEMEFVFDGLKQSIAAMEDAVDYDGSSYAWPGEHGTSSFMPVGQFGTTSKDIKTINEALKVQGAEQAAKMILVKMLNWHGYRQEDLVLAAKEMFIDHPEVLAALKAILRAK